MGLSGGKTPSRLGRYELLARLATGGMGEIFLARLEGAAGFEKLVVIKRILPHLADDARFRQMLITEARLASRLTHANICQVIELGETDGQLYIVMEYLEGVTLLPLLRKASRAQRPLELGFVGGVIQQATDALHYAHELRDREGEPLGIVHRDVTPSNIFLTEAGVTKLLDFGIAKVKDASANTQTGAVKGKYAYMAPEQLRGAGLDRRADVFALGIVVFEMLALRRLFQRKTDYLTFRAVMEQPIPDVRHYRPDAPEALAGVLAQALDRTPANRFGTARQLGGALLDALAPLGRVWTQGDISEFVRHELEESLRKRSAQVAAAVSRSVAGQRATMPLIAHEDESEISDDDEDDEFPAVEDTLSHAPVEVRAARPPQDAREFAGTTGQVTPPPFANETSTSGLSLQPLTPGPAPHAHVVPGRPTRGVLWPLLAIAMVGIAGGALFLVWRQTQQQQPPPVVNITSSSALPTPAEPDEPDEPDNGVEPAAHLPAERSGDRRSRSSTRDARPRGNPYTAALQARRPRINQCATKHGAPPSSVKVVIEVATSGRAKTISLDPASLEATPLGACIKSELSSVTFPRDKEEKQVSVTFKTGASTSAL